jgi:hypothetical protein
MAPLQAWEQDWDEKDKASAAPGSAMKPVLVMLVDALDEADHDNRGCLPVARLLANE